jgi:hypothetical protein
VDFAAGLKRNQAYAETWSFATGHAQKTTAIYQRILLKEGQNTTDRRPLWRQQVVSWQGSLALQFRVNQSQKPAGRSRAFPIFCSQQL